MSGRYVNISPALTCAAQTLRCAEHVEAAAADPQRLLDAVRCGHLALMAALTEALTGSAGIGAFDDKRAGEHLSFLRGERADMPREFMLSFSQLFERVQEPDRLEFSDPLAFTDEETKAAAEMDRLRTLIDHPKPTYWSVEGATLTWVLGLLPAVLEKCVGAAAHRYMDGPDAMISDGLARMRAAFPRVSRALEPRPPEGWGGDELTAYLQSAAENRWATFAHYPAALADMSRLDASFMVLDGWKDPPSPIASLLGFRSHAAFRATCEHALAGQVGDIFPAARSCLEAAAYSVHLHGSAELTEAWLRRHDSDEAMKRARGAEFHHRAVVGSVAALSPDLGALFADLYQQAIDFGGHPNERGMSVNANTRPGDGVKHFEQLYLHGNGPPLRFGLHSAVEVGAAAVGILRLIWSERMGPDTNEDVALRAVLKRTRLEWLRASAEG